MAAVGAAGAAGAAAGAMVPAAAAAAAVAALSPAGDAALDRLAVLGAESKDLKAQNKANKKAIKSEITKKKRLQAKASKLTTAELLEVVAHRTAADAVAKAKAKAKPKPKAKAAAVHPAAVHPGGPEA